MPGARLPMRKIRDVLRLSAAGLSKRQIAASLGIGGDAMESAKTRASQAMAARLEAGLNWDLVDLVEEGGELVGKRLDRPTAHSIGKLFQKRLVGRPAWVGDGQAARHILDVWIETTIFMDDQDRGQLGGICRAHQVALDAAVAVGVLQRAHHARTEDAYRALFGTLTLVLIVAVAIYSQIGRAHV